jgi:FkbM family methyltransferase
MINKIRTLARRYLPASIRTPLGNLGGKFLEHVLHPLEGLIFDISGGRFNANGCTFLIPKNITNRAFRACFLTNAYEIDERRMVVKFIQPEDSVLELGACMGIVSCITNKLLRTPTRHLAVEANPFCLPALHRNRELNQCDFLIENCAASSQKDVTFFLHPKFIVGGTAKLKSALPVRIPGRSLHDLIERYGPFSVLIMDIEGSELEILGSSVDALRNFRLVIIELHDWVIGADGVTRCRELLQQSGFKMAERSFITEVWVRS